MTSYEFEVAAKNALIKVLKDEYGKETKIEELQFVWFAYVLGNKKCCVYAQAMGNLYAEVTYNAASEEMYLDIYRKTTNRLFAKDELDIVAHRKPVTQDVVNCT